MTVKAESDIVAVAELTLQLSSEPGGPSTCVSLRVKPDRRQVAVPFPPALERRIFPRIAAGYEPDEVNVGWAVSDFRVTT